MKIIKKTCFRTPKKDEDIADCQDFCYFSKNCFAIADGSSQSFYSSIWAEKLVKHFCENPKITKDNWQDWLRPIQQEWLKEVETRVKLARDKNLPTWITNQNRLNSFEPATSTFIGLEFLEKEDILNLTIIGDSCLFLVEDKHFSSYLIERADDFNDKPKYFASRSNFNDYEPKFYNIDLREYNTINIQYLLATDALSEFVFNKIENNEAEIFQRLLSISSQKQFEDFVNESRESQSLKMKNDDVALLIITTADVSSESSIISLKNNYLEETIKLEDNGERGDSNELDQNCDNENSVEANDDKEIEEASNTKINLGDNSFKNDEENLSKNSDKVGLADGNLSVKAPNKDSAEDEKDSSNDSKMQEKSKREKVDLPGFLPRILKIIRTINSNSIFQKKLSFANFLFKGTNKAAKSNNLNLAILPILLLLILIIADYVNLNKKYRLQTNISSTKNDDMSNFNSENMNSSTKQHPVDSQNHLNPGSILYSGKNLDEFLFSETIPMAILMKNETADNLTSTSAKKVIFNLYGIKKYGSNAPCPPLRRIKNLEEKLWLRPTFANDSTLSSIENIANNTFVVFSSINNFQNVVSIKDITDSNGLIDQNFLSWCQLEIEGYISK